MDKNPYQSANDPYRPYSFSYYVRSMAQLGMMVAVLMLCADVGFAQAQQYNLQGTANMAAVLGAHQLPDRDAAAKTAASYMENNGFPQAADNVTVVGQELVAVEMRESYTPFFAKWLGIEQVPLRAYAQEQRM